MPLILELEVKVKDGVKTLDILCFKLCANRLEFVNGLDLLISQVETSEIVLEKQEELEKDFDSVNNEEEIRI